ncbi:MAG: acetyl-CoA carboxylase biotin carboxyl carrier protein [Sphingomicrobium sp.]
MADDKQQHSRGDGTMRVDAKLVRELAELLGSSDLNEIEVEDGDRKIKIVRHQKFPFGAGFVGNEHYVPSPQVALPPAPAVAAATAEAAPVSGDAIKSPMVGTAFLSAEPGGKPFVAAGDTVKAGDTLLIVEAMKVMNPITATRAGTVKQLLVADAQPVEFDQPLVIFE